MRSNSAVPFLLGTAVGALTIALISRWPGDVAPPAGAGPPVAGLAPRAQPAPAAGSASTDALERVVARLAAIERRLDTGGERTTATSPVTIDEDTLLAAFVHVRQREERQRCDGMTDRELFDEAEHLLRAGTTDRPRCRRLLEQLLERPLEPSLRAQARRQLGLCLRDLHDYEAASRPLQQSLDECGMRSGDGARAGLDLAMVRCNAADYANGLRLADEIARGGPSGLVFEARWTAAWIARCSGDLTRARADFTALVRDCAGDPASNWIATSSQRQLQEIDAQPR